jgi:hypothetical protein
MNPPEQVKYSRKEFAATLNLLAVEGVAYEARNKEAIAKINGTFFKDYPIPPECLYWVMDTTSGEAIGRGYVFSINCGYGDRSWGYIVRENATFYTSPFPNSTGLTWAAWCKHQSQATACVIRQSRGSWDKAKSETEAETRKRQMKHTFNKIIYRDREILGLPQSFTHDQLKRSYRQLCLKHHPDKGGDTAKFREVNEAYKRLSLTVR